MPKSVYSDAQAALVFVLTSARKNAGILQADLGSKLGKDQSYVSNIERGQRRVDVLEFHELALAIGVDPVELYRRFAQKINSK